MAEFLALKWENQSLHGVEASIGRGKVRIDRCFALEWPAGSKPADQPQLAGAWLKEELLRRGVSSRLVLVLLPREEAVVRPLDLPDAPENELPALVRFQASTKSTVPIDRLLLDYLPLPKQPGAGGRTVLMATISRQLSERIQTVLEAAGLELVSIGLGAAAAAELVVREEQRRAESSDAERLIVVRRGKQVELSIVSRNHLVFTHVAQLAGTAAEQQNQVILAEVSRSVVALQRTLPNMRITRAWVLGSEDENPQLGELLAQRLGCDVRGEFDPLKGAEVELNTGDVPGNRGAYAAVVGSLLARTGQMVEAIDFLHPREPVVVRGVGRRRMVLAGAGALLLAIVAGNWYWSAVSRLETEIANLQTSQQDLTLFNKENKPTLESAKIIGRWDKRNVSWLEQAGKIGESLGGRDRVYLEQLRFSISKGGTGGAIATLQLHGFAKGRPESDALDQQLVKRQFTVKPHASNVDSKDSEYPYRIEVDLELVERPPSHATP